jgi:hypothetical protein
MPRLLRAFATLFIGFPGAIIWINGALLCVKGSYSIFYRQEARNSLDDLVIFAIGATAVALGYLMVIGTRILCGDSRELFAGFHFAERVMWNMGIQLTGILTAGAALTVFICIFTSEWKSLPLPLALLLSFAFVAVRLGQHWARLRDTWLQEIIDARSSRAHFGLDSPRADGH